MRYCSYLPAIAVATLFAAGCSHAPTDADIATQIKARLFSDPLVRASSVSVAVSHGDVTLSGTVGGLDVELQALKLALETQGVKRLDDKMSVVSPPAGPPKSAAQATEPHHRESARSPSALGNPEPVEAPPQDEAEAEPETAPAPAPAPAPSPTRWRVAVLPTPSAQEPPPAEPPPDYAGTVTTRVGGGARSAERRQPQSKPLVVLLAAGPATPAALFAKWGLDFQQADPDARLDYQQTPTVANQSSRSRPADLGAFDIPLSDSTLSQSLNLRVLRFPAAVGGVVPICNIGGNVKALTFSGELLAAIFSGKIARWDDLAIRILNPQTFMPAEQITVIHRSDASDETWLFSEYLSAISPEWKAHIGASPSVSWPAGRGAAGNGGIVSMVRATPNSIGYVDASFALQNRLTACAVENRAGQAVKANPASLSEAAFSLASFGRPDFGASIVNAPGPGAFPIASLLWLGVPEHLADSNKRQALRSFLEWMLTKGQSATGVLGYGPLPEFFVHSERAEINSVQ